MPSIVNGRDAHRGRFSKNCTASGLLFPDASPLFETANTSPIVKGGLIMMTKRFSAAVKTLTTKIHTVHPGLVLPVIGFGAWLTTAAVLVLIEPGKPGQAAPESTPRQDIETTVPPAPSVSPAPVGSAPMASLWGGNGVQADPGMGSAGGSSGGGSSARRAPATTGTATASSSASHLGNTTPASKSGDALLPRGASVPAPIHQETSKPVAPSPQRMAAVPAPMPQPVVPYRGAPAPMPAVHVAEPATPAPVVVVQSAPAADVRPEIAAGLIIGGLVGTILGVGHPTNGHPMNGRMPAPAHGGGGHFGGGGHR